MIVNFCNIEYNEEKKTFKQAILMFYVTHARIAATNRKRFGFKPFASLFFVPKQQGVTQKKR